VFSTIQDQKSLGKNQTTKNEKTDNYTSFVKSPTSALDRSQYAHEGGSPLRMKQLEQQNLLLSA
jgi:hypothetical protein